MLEVPEPDDWKKIVRQAESGRETENLIQNGARQYMEEQGINPRSSHDAEDIQESIREAVAHWGRHFSSIVIADVVLTSPHELLANPHLPADQTLTALTDLQRNIQSQDYYRSEKFRKGVQIAVRRHALPVSDRTVAVLEEGLSRRRRRDLPAGDLAQPASTAITREFCEFFHELREAVWKGQNREDFCSAWNQQLFERRLAESENESYLLENSANTVVANHPLSTSAQIEQLLTEIPDWQVARLASLRVFEGEYEFMDSPQIRKVSTDMARQKLPAITEHTIAVLLTSTPRSAPAIWDILQKATTQDLSEMSWIANLSSEQLARLGRDALVKLAQTDDRQLRQKVIQASRHLEEPIQATRSGRGQTPIS